MANKGKVNLAHKNVDVGYIKIDVDEQALVIVLRLKRPTYVLNPEIAT